MGSKASKKRRKAELEQRKLARRLEQADRVCDPSGGLEEDFVGLESVRGGESTISPPGKTNGDLRAGGSSLEDEATQGVIDSDSEPLEKPALSQEVSVSPSESTESRKRREQFVKAVKAIREGSEIVVGEVLLTGEEVAKLLRISRATFYRLVKANVIPGRIELEYGPPRYLRSAVIEWLEQQAKGAEGGERDE